MTQEAFKAWWYNEGSQAPYTHHDCEEHTMRMCEIAWANGAYKEREALAQTQEPVCPECKAVVLYECVACSSNNYPPQRTQPNDINLFWRAVTTPEKWVGLTAEEVLQCWEKAHEPGNKEHINAIRMADEVEQALKEKNCG